MKTNSLEDWKAIDLGVRCKSILVTTGLGSRVLWERELLLVLKVSMFKDRVIEQVL